MPSIFLKNSTMCPLTAAITRSSSGLDPGLIRIVTSLTWSLSITLHHKLCPTCLVPHIKFISFPLNSSFRANPAQTRGVEILTGLTWELCVERGLQALSHNFAPSPHYSLFVTSIFILVHTYTIKSLIRGQ